MCSLLLPYVPNCLSLILKTNWKQEAQRSFINSFVESNKDNISEWSNKGVKEEKLSILTAEGPNTLNLFIDYAWDLCTNVLSVVFNILALSLVVEPLFAFSYGISVSCVVVIMNMKRRTQRQLTQKALIARVDLSQSLLAAWDNVLLGNHYNFNLWYERTAQRLKRCLQRNVDLERFDQVLAICVALITSIPSLAVVAYSMVEAKGDTARLTSFVVILPLLFQILSYTYLTLSLGFRWAMHRSKLITIYRAIQPIAMAPQLLERKIKWPKIVATHSVPDASFSTVNEGLSPEVKAQDPKVQEAKTLDSHADLLSATNGFGRVTLRGDNGSGKSTALMLIKNSLSARAFFLPVHNQLSFTSEANKYSTGESLRNRLLEIFEKVEADVLLLDEWDANLDAETRERLSALIDQMSSKKCVIEVRHR
jgi:ABC-type transport system involved in cytochrome bd biosynthesis fused ATPase/permease subunit